MGSDDVIWSPPKDRMRIAELFPANYPFDYFYLFIFYIFVLIFVLWVIIWLDLRHIGNLYQDFGRK